MQQKDNNVTVFIGRIMSDIVEIRVAMSQYNRTNVTWLTNWSNISIKTVRAVII